MAKREGFSEEEILKLGTALEDTARKAGLTEQSLIKILKATDKLPKKLKEVSKIKYKELINETNKLSSELDKLYRKQGDGQKGLGEQVQALEKLKKKNVEQISLFGKMGDSAGGFGNAIGALSSKFPALSSAMGALSGPLAILTFAIGHVVKVFDKWVEVQKNYTASTGKMQQGTGATAKQFDQITAAASKMRNTFRDLESDATGDSPSIEFIAELGMEYRNLNKAAGDMDFANAMLQVSRTTGLGTSETVAFHRAVEALDITSTTGEFMDLSQEINRFGEDMGVLPALIYKDFVKSKDSIARFGKEGVKVFKDVSRLANHFGIEADQIFKSMERFDTFGTASDEVNQFNAIMGTTLSSFELMMDTDPTSRLEKIRNSVKSQGKSWNDLGYEQKKALSQMLGLSEEQAARVIDSKMSIEDLKKVEHAAAQEAKKNDERKLTSQEEFTKALQRSSVVFEDMARAMEKNMIAQARATDSASRKVNKLGVDAINSATRRIEAEGDVTKNFVADWEAGITVIGKSLGKLWDDYWNWSNDIDASFLRGAESMVSMIAGMPEAYSKWSKEFDTAVRDGWSVIADTIEGFIRNIASKISSVAITFKNTFIEAINAIKDKIMIFIDPILSLISKLESLAVTTGSVTNPISNATGSIGSFLESIIPGIGNSSGADTVNATTASRSNALTNSSVVSKASEKVSQIVNRGAEVLRVITSDINMDGKKVGEAHVQVALGR